MVRKRDSLTGAFPQGLQRSPLSGLLSQVLDMHSGDRTVTCPIVTACPLRSEFFTRSLSQSHRVLPTRTNLRAPRSSNALNAVNTLLMEHAIVSEWPLEWPPEWPARTLSCSLRPTGPQSGSLRNHLQQWSAPKGLIDSNVF